MTYTAIVWSVAIKDGAMLMIVFFGLTWYVSNLYSSRRYWLQWLKQFVTHHLDCIAHCQPRSATITTSRGIAQFTLPRRSRTLAWPQLDDNHHLSTEPSMQHSRHSGRACKTTCTVVIMSSPVKAWSLDPVPTFIVCKFTYILLPFITSMVKASLTQCHQPDSQKYAMVSSLLRSWLWTQPTWQILSQFTTGLPCKSLSEWRPSSLMSSC